MKKELFVLCAIIPLLFSCKKDIAPSIPDTSGTESEVEISLSMPGDPATRATPDPGSYSERNIEQLDLLIFKNDEYQYRRAAHRVNDLTNNFRATLFVDNATLTVYLLANARSFVEAWDPNPQAGTHEDKDWETVAKELTDNNPSALLTASSHKPLPMWGVVTGSVNDTGLNKWGTVYVMRSVASADIFVHKGAGTSTSGFVLTDAYVYFAPNKGYIGIRDEIYVPGTPFGVTGPDSPTGMKTTVKLHSTSVAGDAAADSIAHKLFMYDNTVSTTTADKANDLRFSRVVVGGYYTPTGASETNTTTKSYYPIDFMTEDGDFRRITRNWKYVFNITGVIGPGYSDPDVAAENYPVDINVTVIPWNNEDMEIGQQGPNYISMERKYSYLRRSAGSVDTIGVVSNIPASALLLKFEGEADPTAPYPTSIENDDFTVTMIIDPVTQTLAGLEIKAKHAYDPNNNTATAVLRYGSILYNITIVQEDKDPYDWELGGEDNSVLG